MVGAILGGKKTVDGIMSGFSKMIKDLENLISDETALNVKRDEEIRLMEQAKLDSDVEIGRANRVLTNIKSLMS